MPLNGPHAVQQYPQDLYEEEEPDEVSDNKCCKASLLGLILASGAATQAAAFKQPPPQPKFSGAIAQMGQFAAEKPLTARNFYDSTAPLMSQGSGFANQTMDFGCVDVDGEMDRLREELEAHPEQSRSIQQRMTDVMRTSMGYLSDQIRDTLCRRHPWKNRDLCFTPGNAG